MPLRRSEAFTPPPRPQADDSGTVEVRLGRSGRTLQLARGVPLLEGRVPLLRSEAFTPPPRPRADDSGTVEVRLGRSGRTLQLARGVPLLEALEAEGLKPKSGCRMGICNTCACGKSAGATRDLRTGTAQSEATSALKLCINSAVSDLVLDL